MDLIITQLIVEFLKFVLLQLLQHKLWIFVHEVESLYR